MGMFESFLAANPLRYHSYRVWRDPVSGGLPTISISDGVLEDYGSTVLPTISIFDATLEDYGTGGGGTPETALAPTSIVATALINGAIVSFLAPSNAIAAGVTSYTVTVTPGGATVTGAGSPITIANLTAGVSYTFKVVANGTTGAGTVSATSNAVVPTTTPVEEGAITYLTADGSTLRDAYGTEVVLRSISWYGMESTLVPTSVSQRRYKTGMVLDTDISPTPFEQIGVLDAIKAAGFNSIRIPICEDVATNDRYSKFSYFYLDPNYNTEFFIEDEAQWPPGANKWSSGNQPIKPAIQILDLLIDHCETLGLRVIIDMHCSSPNSNNATTFNGRWYTTATPGTATPNTGAREEPRNEQHLFDAWAFLANRYKNRPIVCSFDLVNEPYNSTWDAGSAYPETNIRYLYERLGKSIQAINPDVFMWCEGIHHKAWVDGSLNDYVPLTINVPGDPTPKYWGTYWAGNLSDVGTAPVVLDIPGKVGYSPHEYSSYAGSASMAQQYYIAGNSTQPLATRLEAVWDKCWGYLVKNNIAPVWIGEYAAPFHDDVEAPNYSAEQKADDMIWINKLTDYCNTYGIGASWWCVNPGMHGLFNGSYSAVGAIDQVRLDAISGLLNWTAPVDPSATVTTLAPTSDAFPETDVGSTSTTKTFTLTNTSPSAGVSLGSVSVTGDFELVAPIPPAGTTILAGGTLQIKVAFKPTASGSRTGALNVSTTAATGSNLSATLTGTGFVMPTFPVLSTSGRNIVQSGTSTVVKLKSVNWFGGESTNNFPHGIWARSYKAIIDQIAGMGFNCIRMPFSGETFATGKTINGVLESDADNQDFIKTVNPTGIDEYVTPAEAWATIIRYAARRGLYVVLDHHRRWAGAGADGAPTDATYTTSSWHATWATVANLFKTHTNVIGADLHNEPHDLDWSTWATMCEAAAAQIHAVAPNWLIMVEGVGGSGFWWGGNLTGVSTRPVVLGVANKVVYSPHEYGQSVGSQSWLRYDGGSTPSGWPTNLPAVFRAAWGYIAENNIAPLWIGEYGGHFGVDGSGAATKPHGTYEAQWVAQLATYANTYGINAAYWSYNPNSADTGGLVQDDWTTPQTVKLNLIQPLLQ